MSAPRTRSTQRRCVYASDLDEDDPALELVVLRFDSGNEMVIHAMKARQRYLDLLR